MLQALYLQDNWRARQAGYSLLEFSVVVLILGILAAVVIPDFSTTKPASLDLAVGEVTQALRLARSESMRTGEMHGVTVNQSTQQVTVKKYDLTTDPISTDFILMHPVDKKPFQFRPGDKSLTAQVVISNGQDAFLYADNARRKSILFDQNGTPVWFVGSTDSVYQLVDGSITLSYGDTTRSITVAPLSGRVSAP